MPDVAGDVRDEAAVLDWALTQAGLQEDTEVDAGPAVLDLLSFPAAAADTDPSPTPKVAPKAAPPTDEQPTATREGADKAVETEESVDELSEVLDTIKNDNNVVAFFCKYIWLYLNHLEIFAFKTLSNCVLESLRSVFGVFLFLSLHFPRYEAIMFYGLLNLFSILRDALAEENKYEIKIDEKTETDSKLLESLKSRAFESLNYDHGYDSQTSQSCWPFKCAAAKKIVHKSLNIDKLTRKPLLRPGRAREEQAVGWFAWIFGFGSGRSKEAEAVVPIEEDEQDYDTSDISEDDESEEEEDDEDEDEEYSLELLDDEDEAEDEVDEGGGEDERTWNSVSLLGGEDWFSVDLLGSKEDEVGRDWWEVELGLDPAWLSADLLGLGSTGRAWWEVSLLSPAEPGPAPVLVCAEVEHDSRAWYEVSLVGFCDDGVDHWYEADLLSWPADSAGFHDQEDEGDDEDDDDADVLSVNLLGYYETVDNRNWFDVDLFSEPISFHDQEDNLDSNNLNIENIQTEDENDRYQETVDAEMIQTTDANEEEEEKEEEEEINRSDSDGESSQEETESDDTKIAETDEEDKEEHEEGKQEEVIEYVEDEEEVVEEEAEQEEAEEEEEVIEEEEEEEENLTGWLFGSSKNRPEAIEEKEIDFILEDEAKASTENVVPVAPEMEAIKGTAENVESAKESSAARAAVRAGRNVVILFCEY